MQLLRLVGTGRTDLLTRSRRVPLEQRGARLLVFSMGRTERLRSKRIGATRPQSVLSAVSELDVPHSSSPVSRPATAAALLARSQYTSRLRKSDLRLRGIACKDIQAAGLEYGTHQLVSFGCT